MPRIASKKREYAEKDLSAYIVGQMYSQNISQEQVAEMLNTTQPNISYKLRRHLFSYGELLEIFDLLGTSDADKVRLMTL